MKNLLDILYVNQFNDKILFEEYNQDVNNVIINESFKSTLLKNLAKRIYDIEAKHRESDKRDKEKGGFYYNREKTFSSIFGPITTNAGKYSEKSGIQGLKWSEISDDDFDLATGDDIAKKLKPLYKKKVMADCIVCKPGTKDPLLFIKGYGEKQDVTVYTLMNNSTWETGVKELLGNAYKYKSRNLKYDEVVDIVDGYDVYILTITNDMIKDYKTLHNDRKESQRGAINYDKDSLEKLLNQQKSRYKTLVSEMKANKLQNNKEDLFNDIKKINDEVVQLYQDIMSKPENLNEYYDLGRLMSYVSYAYESFYKSMKYQYKADKAVEHAQKERGVKPEEAQKWGEYDREYAKNEINDAQDYVKKIRKEIDTIRAEMK